MGAAKRVDIARRRLAWCMRRARSMGCEAVRQDDTVVRKLVRAFVRFMQIIGGLYGRIYEARRS